MISYREIHVLDRNSEFFGVPQSQLMENAGKGIANAVMDNFNLKGKSVLIVCGTGNNGGDGYVAARYLKDRCKVKIMLIKPKNEIRSELALENLDKAISSGIDVLEPPTNADKEMKRVDIIIDSILGIGINKDLKEPYSSVVKKLNNSGKKIVSVDVPSGLGTNMSVKPAMTVTFHDAKEGMNAKNSGKIIVADIGIPKEAELYAGPGEFVYYPVPKDDSHKGDNGRVLIVGGGPYTGAPSLAGFAAYRIGVDLVRLAVPTKCYQVVASFSPNFLMHPLEGEVINPSHLKYLAAFADNIDSVLVGPGAGDSSATLTAMSEFIKRCARPLVIDADGLKSIAKNPSILKGKSGIITPHRGEFELITRKKTPDDIELQKEKVSDLASKTGFTVILKGRVDVISDGSRTKLNKTGHASMSVGGTGDVLAGLCVGLLSKGVSPFEAARMAAFINGTAGELAFQNKSYSALATDIIDEIPNVLKKYLR